MPSVHARDDADGGAHARARAASTRSCIAGFVASGHGERAEQFDEVSDRSARARVSELRHDKVGRRMCEIVRRSAEGSGERLTLHAGAQAPVTSSRIGCRRDGRSR